MIEAQVRYILSVITQMRKRGAVVATLKRPVQVRDRSAGPSLRVIMVVSWMDVTRGMHTVVHGASP
eukprot:52206-Eustigmatos_ZCMA.PRE.1